MHPWRLSAVVLTLTASCCIPARSDAGEVSSTATTPKSVGFDRHVEGLIGRLGCNAGTCHGSTKGKGGLRLSLFGADPAKDHATLLEGGRIDRDSPAESLLLRKPIGQVKHGGGRRIETGSWEFQVVLRWIEQGAKRGQGASVRQLIVTPTEVRLTGPGGGGDLRATAEFSDGTHEDVTAFCTFRSADEEVVDVSGNGHVQGRRPGAAAVVVGYGASWASATVLVPRQVSADFVYPDVPATNFIDRLVLDRLRSLNVVPSSTCTDEEFLRRLTIDVTASLPTPKEVREFLADKDPDKRAKKIDQLLSSPRHAALWATKFCDWTACDVNTLGEPRDLRLSKARMWRDWFQKRLSENISCDRIVRGVLCGTTRGGQKVSTWLPSEIARLQAARNRGTDPGYADRPFLDLYWQRSAGGVPFSPERLAEVTASAFLGLRLQCAQCHRHPTGRWTQTDYRAFANVFARVRLGQSPDLRAAMVDFLEARRANKQSGDPVPRVQEVYLEDSKERYLWDPMTSELLSPRAPGGPTLDDTGDSREALVAWMTSPRNPYFARNFANRVWQHYFGRGLVEPVDDFSDSHPPIHSELLDALAADFVAGNFDLRRLERVVLNSRTYQLSLAANATNKEDRSGFARFQPRRPMAEVVADLLHDALGVAPDFRPDAPAGVRAVEVATSRPQNPFLARLARTYGRPERSQLCDCERRSQPTMAESLLLMCDPTLLDLTGRGRVAELVRSDLSVEQEIEELYLGVLSRRPRPNEREAAEDYLRGKPNRADGLQGLLWALVNTREFILVH
ncbi:MAG TPA: DUF1549 and DUF1553 domain-containing protein [Gemmataceae bacterium]|nr:DUF1549 and DUF1553 domain-containing protein [Gemmataceae bacterium]